MEKEKYLKKNQTTLCDKGHLRQTERRKIIGKIFVIFILAIKMSRNSHKKSTFSG